VHARHCLTLMQVDYAHAEQDESIEANAGNLGTTILPFRNITISHNSISLLCEADMPCHNTPQQSELASGFWTQLCSDLKTCRTPAGSCLRWLRHVSGESRVRHQHQSVWCSTGSLVCREHGLKSMCQAACLCFFYQVHFSFNHPSPMPLVLCQTSHVVRLT